MTDSFVRKFQKPLRQVEQLLQDPSVFIKDMRIEPHTPLLRTNNFLQNTLARNLVFSPSERKFVRMKGDEEGRTEVYVGMPSSLENRITYFGVVRNVANGATRVFLTADRMLGTADIPYTVPNGKKIFVNHVIMSGTSPGELKLQALVAGTWTDVEVAFFDSYDEIDIFWLISQPYTAGSQLRVAVVNHGGTGDFSLDLTGWLEKEGI